jgi:methylmalonyl-CoA mutase N-terminal domain/subunit
MDLFEEVAKLRAARRLWYRIATERFGATEPASGRLRFFSGNAGTTLTAQQPLNNVVRSTIQCLGAVLGGAQSIHVMGYDEAYEIPSEEAVTLSLRTQQIIALESGVARTADPLAGSYFVEALTDELEARARVLLEELDTAGGAAAAIEAGIPQRWIAESAYRLERDVSSGERPRARSRTSATCSRPIRASPIATPPAPPSGSQRGIRTSAAPPSRPCRSPRARAATSCRR